MAPIATLLAIAAATALALAGCAGGSGGAGDRTDPPPPDRLAVTLEPEAGPTFRVALDCGVADLEACSQILEALGEAGDDETCLPLPDSGERIVVRGTIGGEEVGAALERRTDCEARVYDRVREALGPG